MTDHPPRWDEQAATATVLTVNPGSSSVKAVLRDPAPSLTVEIERLGTDQARWTTTAAGQGPASGQFVGDLPAAITLLAELVTRRGVRPDAVAHRVVHGGPSFDRATVITDPVREALTALVAWAPLHLPGDLASIDAARTAWPQATHVACFDTAFHHTLPDEARRLPLPEQADRLGVRRYGFHGLSVQSIVDAVPDLGDAVIAHLGSGCSVTAVSGGRSVHTSMSLTPTSGVMSATRSGDLDPEIPLLLVDQPDATADTVRDLLDRHSGLAGIAHGLHDVRDLLAARDRDPGADLALRVFTRDVAMAVAAAATALPRWNTLVFTAGIGEHAPAVCGEICRRLTSLRPPLSGRPTATPATATQAGTAAGVRELTATGVRVLIVPADEAEVMDREARALLAVFAPDSASAGVGRGTSDRGKTSEAAGNWVAAGPLTQLKDDTAVHVDLAGHPVCLARSCGMVYAMLDECSHGQVLLSEGDVEDRYVECWLHGSRFDLATGVPTGPPATRPVPVYPVRVIGGDVEVALPARPQGAKDG